MSSFHLLLQRHEGSLCLKEPLTLEEWISCSVNGGVWCHSSLKGWFKGRNTGRGRFGGESNVQIVKIISSFNRILRVPTVRPTVRLYTSWREWAGFHQKGVEWKWTELSDEITMATRTSAVQSEGGGGGGGGDVGGSFMLKRSEVGGNRSSLFTVFREILMAAVQALTVMNSSHTLTHSRSHTHTHHYITDYNSYITRPRGHWGNYSLLTSVPAGQINKNAFFFFPRPLNKFMFPDGSKTPKKCKQTQNELKISKDCTFQRWKIYS